MAATEGAGAGDLLARVLVPVATQRDARATARALEPYPVGAVRVLYVVEKGDGVPDKTPVEQSESVAAAAFDAFRETFPEAEETVTYDRDIAGAIHRSAEAFDASAIAFRPRGGSRLVQFLAGDTALKLVTEANRPVVALPTPGDQEAGGSRDT
jgi:nucleotide-binding universal stress UspA family protein